MTYDLILSGQVKGQTIIFEGHAIILMGRIHCAQELKNRGRGPSVSADENVATIFDHAFIYHILEHVPRAVPKPI